MIVTATLRVRSKHAEALKALVRGLSAQIALEAAPEIEEVEDEIRKEVIPVEAPPAAEPEWAANPATEPARAQEEDESAEQGFQRAEDEARPGDGNESAVEGAGHDDAGLGLAHDADRELAGASGQGAVA